MRRITFIFMAFMAVACSQSDSAESFDVAMMNPYGREYISLNGEWSVLIDPFLIGEEESRMVYDDVKDPSALFYEYSFDGARQMEVPGDWNHQFEDMEYYEGHVWYARNFDAPQHKDGRHFLYFAGVSNSCKVYLNGELLGSHEGAFTPFEFEVTGKLRQTGNFLCLCVSNIRRPDAIPAMSFDWWNYGGITRDVMLVSTSDVFVRDYFFCLDTDNPSALKAEVTLSSNAAPGTEVKVEIPELRIDEVLKTGKDGKASVTVQADSLRLWDISDPVLYDIKVSSGGRLSAVCDRIGFRNVRTEGEKIMLNGKPVFLKGITFHEEIPQQRRRACTEEDARQLLEEVAALGCNMVRLSHYPQNEHIVRMAEEMGIVLWEEIPLWQGIDFTDRGTYIKAQRYARDMIARDRNRCSILLWSLSNETRPGEARDRFMSDLLEYARSLDDSRLFTSAFSILQIDEQTGSVSMNDSFAREVDVVGINLYMGWYRSWTKYPSEYSWSVSRGKPLVFSEFGAEALYGKHGNRDKADSWSEDYQEQLYKDNLKMIDGIGNLSGVVPWLLYDFRSPYRLHPQLQQGWNRKGVLSENGERKKSWFVLRDYFQNK